MASQPLSAWSPLRTSQWRRLAFRMLGLIEVGALVAGVTTSVLLATAFSLDLESQERLLGLFQRVMGMAIAGQELPRAPQGPGRYVDADEFERLRRVRPGDDLDRKLRAFWYPPHAGALVEVEGRDLTLVDERLLAEVAQAYRDSGMVP